MSIRTLKFAVQRDPANSRAIGYHATQMNTAYNVAIDVLNREPKLPKRSGKNHRDAMNKRTTAWRQANRQQAQAPYYIHQEGGEQAWEANQRMQASREERLERVAKAEANGEPPKHRDVHPHRRHPDQRRSSSVNEAVPRRGDAAFSGFHVNLRDWSRLREIMRKRISIAEIADTHGKRRQTVHKIAKRMGITTIKAKSDQTRSRGQMISYITIDDYDRLKEQLDHQGALDTKSTGGSAGVFYVVQLEPHSDPGRFKVGHTTDMDARLRSHKTTAPYSKIIKEWPCKSLWEKTAIECVSQGCEQLYTEVFRTDDLMGVVNKGEQFFGIMPHIENDPVELLTM